MLFGINHNLMAMNVSRNLGNHYQELGVSTRRLSSGLRIGTAADDAAGLAVRELMRSDVTTLNQGVRNANDAISMIQTADGALQIINEKLIRMKELAEQSATGTYSDDQRIIINSEFQAMKAEIYRIAKATEFNGIYLLNGNLSGKHDGSGLQSTGGMKIHFGSGNCSAEDYYYVNIPQVQDEGINIGGTIVNGPGSSGSTYVRDWWVHQGTATHNIDVSVINSKSIVKDAQKFEIFYGISSPRMGTGAESTPLVIRSQDNINYDFKNFQLAFDPAGGLNKWSILNGIPGTSIITDIQVSNTETRITLPDGTLIGGLFHLGIPTSATTVTFDLSSGAGVYDPSGAYLNAKVVNMSGGNIDVSLDGSSNVDVKASISGYNSLYNAFAKMDLKSNIKYQEGALKLDTCFVSTQTSAQKSLDNMRDATVSSNKIRANLGATQNRLENTITNLQIQAENLQDAESQISDVDVADEMTNFVKEQILSQAATAMLAQANSIPKMAIQLISGG